MGGGVKERSSSSYGAIVMKAFEKFCRENSSMFREAGVKDASQQETPTTSSNPVVVKDGEFSPGELPVHSNALASTSFSTPPQHSSDQENVPTHTQQQTDLPYLAPEETSMSTRPIPSRPEGNVPIPAQQPERFVSTPTIPSRLDGNVPTPAQRQESALPSRPRQGRLEGTAHRRANDPGSVKFIERSVDFSDNRPSLPTPIAQLGSSSPDRSLVSLVNHSGSMNPSTAKPCDVTCYKVGGENTNCWVFPANISQATLDGRNGSNACTVITMILGSVILHLDLPYPRAGPLSPLWCSLVEKGIRLGNKIHDENEQGRRNLTPLEAVYALRSVKNIHVDEPLAVRLRDPHEPSQLAYQIQRMLVKKKSAAAFVQGDRSFLLMTEESGHVLAIDTHTHMDGSRGAVIVTSNALTDIASFILAIEATFSLEEDSFGNFVKFY
ncbi:uncharacterized protein LOC114526039 isoform X2 [Dendronephthya gigantea]|nr:uncharacterized protein LOC114526039 isoform X2 [Dendronephthya gigantea]XP_028403334.1 uncharacterized protein LOC114526039 isoform X2 [Dendronephthya gigantea]